MKMKIKKIKLSMFKSLEVSFNELSKEGEVIGDHKTNYTAVAHPDLLKHFKLLVPHFLLLTDLEKSVKLFELLEMPEKERMTEINEMYSKYNVSAVSEGGADENTGLVLTGQKTISNGKVFNINSPFYQWAELESFKYGSDLKKLWNKLTHETELYIDGKVDKLPSLFDKEKAEETDPDNYMTDINKEIDKSKDKSKEKKNPIHDALQSEMIKDEAKIKKNKPISKKKK